MFFKRLLPVVLVVALPACSASVTPIQLTARHPASPLAAEAPTGESSNPLTPQESAAGINLAGLPAEEPPAAEPVDHSHHGMVVGPAAIAAPRDHPPHGMAPTPGDGPIADEPEPDRSAMVHSAHETEPTGDSPPANPVQR